MDQLVLAAPEVESENYAIRPSATDSRVVIRMPDNIYDHYVAWLQCIDPVEFSNIRCPMALQRRGVTERFWNQMLDDLLTSVFNQTECNPCYCPWYYCWYTPCTFARKDLAGTTCCFDLINLTGILQTVYDILTPVLALLRIFFCFVRLGFAAIFCSRT